MQPWFSRRQFLGGTAAAAAVLAFAPMPLPAFAEGTTKTLAPRTARALAVISRHMYPHAGLADMYYEASVKALDEKAAADSELAALLEDGVADLDARMPVPFLELSPGHQRALLNDIADGDFFQAVRGHTVVGLYDNDLVWRYFGYEGPSYGLGGYLERGFNDIAWLPAA